MSNGPKGISKKFNIDFQDSTSLSPLHYGALCDNREIIELLIDSGASLDITDCNGMSPLHLACWKDALNALDILIEAGANVNLQSRSGDTPLHLAVQDGHFKVVKFLLTKSIAATMKNRAGETALDLACQYGYKKVVEALLEGIWKEKFVHIHKDDQSPLMTAARCGRADIVNVLVEAGFDINRKAANGTALHEATLFSKIEVVELLIEHEIDVMIKNDFGETALDIANKFNSSVLVDEICLLIEGAMKEKEKPSSFRHSIRKSAHLDQDNENSDKTNNVKKSKKNKASSFDIPESSTVAQTEIVIEHYPDPRNHLHGIGSNGRGSGNHKRSNNMMDVRDHSESGQIISSHTSVPLGFISINSNIRKDYYSPKVSLGLQNHAINHDNSGRSKPVRIEKDGAIVSAFNQITTENAGYINQLNIMQNIASHRLLDISPTGKVPLGKDNYDYLILSFGIFIAKNRVAISVTKVKLYPGMMRARTLSMLGPKRISRLDFSSDSIEERERTYSIDFSHDVYTLNPAIDGAKSTVEKGKSDSKDFEKPSSLKLWLHTIDQEEYSNLFIQAGVDMKILPYLSMQEYNAIGITDSSDQRVILNEAISLPHFPILIARSPYNVKHWLQLLQLSEYLSNFSDNEYESISSVIDITQEDLNEIGIHKLGHVKKILLSLECIRAKFNRNSFHRFSSETNLATYSVTSRSPSPAETSVPIDDSDIKCMTNSNNHLALSDGGNIYSFWRLSNYGSNSSLRKESPSSNYPANDERNGIDSMSSSSEENDMNYYSFLSPNLKSYCPKNAKDDDTANANIFNYDYDAGNYKQVEGVDNPIQDLWDSVTGMQDSLLFTKIEPSHYCTEMDDISNGFDKMAESLQSPPSDRETNDSLSSTFNYCDDGSMRSLADRLTYLSRLDLIYLDALANMFFSTAKEFEVMLTKLD
ncbi:Caskin-1 [Trichoplax sp. H2]|nr:Caskin-1 [Trichoplax sp. H2]|eukprot:RDD44016.1 Caskin-1 [Trichoplax sp. H2]